MIRSPRSGGMSLGSCSWEEETIRFTAGSLPPETLLSYHLARAKLLVLALDKKVTSLVHSSVNV